MRGSIEWGSGRVGEWESGGVGEWAFTQLSPSSEVLRLSGLTQPCPEMKTVGRATLVTVPTVPD